MNYESVVLGDPTPRCPGPVVSRFSIDRGGSASCWRSVGPTKNVEPRRTKEAISVLSAEAGDFLKLLRAGDSFVADGNVNVPP